MAFMYPDRIRETSTTKGTGAITLAGAPTGWRTFSSGLSAADTFPYVIEGRDANGNQTAEWETGIGYLSASTTLVRETVKASSNSGAAVNFSAGTKDVYCDLIAEGADNTNQGHYIVASRGWNMP